MNRTLCRWTVLAALACVPVCAQETQLLPEVDAYLKLNSVVRTYLEAKDDRDGGDPNQLAIGPSVQFYLKPLIKLKDVTAFDLDDAKTRLLVVESGYRFIAQPNTAAENRLVESATGNFPFSWGIHISDRSRFDLDWKNSVFTWRYRNKLTIERAVAIRSYHLIPYIAAEGYYESQYSKWSTTTLFAGCLLPVGKHIEFNTYYQHQNDTSKHPNKPSNGIGLALYLYFSVAKS